MCYKLICCYYREPKPIIARSIGFYMIFDNKKKYRLNNCYKLPIYSGGKSIFSTLSKNIDELFKTQNRPPKPRRKDWWIK